MQENVKLYLQCACETYTRLEGIGMPQPGEIRWTVQDPSWYIMDGMFQTITLQKTGQSFVLAIWDMNCDDAHPNDSMVVHSDISLENLHLALADLARTDTIRWVKAVTVDWETNLNVCSSQTNLKKAPPELSKIQLVKNNLAKIARFPLDADAREIVKLYDEGWKVLCELNQLHSVFGRQPKRI